MRHIDGVVGMHAAGGVWGERASPGGSRTGNLSTWKGDRDYSLQAGVVVGGSNVREREGSLCKIEYRTETAGIDLDDQQSPWVQVGRRAFDQGAQDIHSVGAGMEGDGWFAPNVGRQVVHLGVGEVRGIGRDDVDCAVEGVEKVSVPGVDAVVESVRSDVCSGNAEGGLTPVSRKYRCVWQVVSEGDRDCSAACADVGGCESRCGRVAVSRKLQYCIDQVLRLLTGYEDVLGYHEVETVELAAACKIGEWLALQAALQDLLEGLRAARGHGFVQPGEEGGSIDAEGCAEERLGL